MSHKVEQYLQFPRVLCDLIALFALPDEFEIEIADYAYRKYVGGTTVTLPGYRFRFTDRNIEGRASLPFFTTISDIAQTDREYLQFHVQSADGGYDDPSSVIRFFETPPPPYHRYDTQSHDHLSYYASPTVQLLSSSEELAHDVRLWDLPAVSGCCDGKRLIYRRLQEHFVTRDTEDPWCCGKREGGLLSSRLIYGGPVNF